MLDEGCIITTDFGDIIKIELFWAGRYWIFSTHKDRIKFEKYQFAKKRYEEFKTFYQSLGYDIFELRKFDGKTKFNQDCEIPERDSAVRSISGRIEDQNGIRPKVLR